MFIYYCLPHHWPRSTTRAAHVGVWPGTGARRHRGLVGRKDEKKQLEILLSSIFRVDGDLTKGRSYTAAPAACGYLYLN